MQAAVAPPLPLARPLRAVDRSTGVPVNRLAAALTCAIVLAPAARPDIVAARQAAVETDALLVSLCEGWNTAGDEIVLAGDRIAVARRAPHDSQSATASQWLKVVASDPDLLFAAHNEWVVVYKRGTETLRRRDCRTSRTDVLPEAGALMRIAVSPGGDVAMLAEAGTIAVAGGSSAYSPTQTPIGSSPRAPKSGLAREALVAIARRTPDPATQIWWNGSQLLAIGPRTLSTTRFDGTAQRTLTRNAVGASAVAGTTLDGDGGVRRAFVLNGVLHVRRGACWDLYVGDTLTPAVRAAACHDAPDTLVSADTEHLHFRSAGSGDGATVTRPTLVAATLGGSTRDISTALAAVVRTRPAGRDGGPQRAGVDAIWARWLPADAWPDRSIQAGLRELESHGWKTLSPDGAWWVADGLAVKWDDPLDFVRVDGRSLEQLAREQRGLSAFTDAQVTAIIENNRGLVNALEGQLIAQRWLPVGALLGPPTRLPLAFEAVETLGGPVERTPEPPSNGTAGSTWPELRRVLLSCDVSRAETGTPLGPLDRLVGRGVELAGGVDLEVAKLVTASASRTLLLKAGRIWVAACGGGASAASSASEPVVRLLLADGLVVGPLVDRDQAPRTAITGVESPTQAGYRPTGSSQQPVAIKGPIVLGIQRPAWRDRAPSEEYAAHVRHWLDSIVRNRPQLGSILMPTITLRLIFVAGTDEQRRLNAIPNVTVRSAESAPAKTRRAEACPSSLSASVLRSRHEQLLRLDGVSASQRSVERTFVAIAENDVALGSTIFARANGASIWLYPDEQGQPRPMNLSEMRPVQRLEDKLHGTAISALIAATAPPVGVVTGTQPIWLDLRKPLIDLDPALAFLAARGAVLNFSVQLPAPWAGLENEASTPKWRENMLLVAAVRNPNETEHGFPLAWKGEPTVVGVGTLNADGSVPGYYSRDYVDVLAPGQQVATLDENGALVCESGTSFATAYVSAVAALLADSDTSLRMWQIRARLLATAEWSDAYRGRVKGGMVNAKRALEHLHANVLAVQIGTGATTSSENWRVVLDDRAAATLTIRGTRAVAIGQALNRDQQRIDWNKVLRLQRTGEEAGAPVYRVTFIDDADRFVVYEDARLVHRTEPIPIATIDGRDQCESLSLPGEAMQCRGTTTEQIVDYVRGIGLRSTILGFR